MNVGEENKRQIQNMRTNFKHLREARCWTVEQLSERSNLPATDLLAIENGQDFEVSLLIRLCKFYQIKPYQIFGPLNTW